MVNFKQKFKNFSNDLNIQEIRVYRIKKRQKIKHVLVKKNSIIIEEKKKKSQNKHEDQQVKYLS